MIDPATERFYATRAEEWASHLPHDRSPRIARFLEHLPPGARILELGCGDGRDAEYMEKRGFTVDATDGVAAMVELANRRLKRPARQMLFAELDASEAYDAVWAHASLLHVAEAELPQILQRVYRALKPCGWHFACYKGGEGGHRDQFGRFYSYILQDTLAAAYRSAGTWDSFEMESEQGSSFGGEPTPWLNVTARKAARI